jgi:hypothetical protein
VSNGWRTRRDGPVQIQVPEEWVDLDEGTGPMVMAEPERTDGGFRANVVVLHRESEQPVHEAGALAIAEVFALPAPTHVLSNDVWDLPEGPGRMLDFLWWQGDVCVSVLRWTVATGRRVVEVTASVGVLDRTGYEELLVAVAARLAVEEDR